MRYISELFLERIIEVQNITLEHKDRGASQVWIYENKIRPIFRISFSTYNRWLGRNAKRELKEIKEKKNADSKA